MCYLPRKSGHYGKFRSTIVLAILSASSPATALNVGFSMSLWSVSLIIADQRVPQFASYRARVGSK